MNIKIGCDPELFVFDKKDNRFVSAHDLLPGTKEEPYLLNGGAVQVDGIAAEINTNPTHDALEFVELVRGVRRLVEGMLGDRYELRAIPVVRLDKELWDKLPDKAKELGCDPDYNAYTGKVNPQPNVKTDFRTGAGHIHVGWTEGMDPMDEGHFQACRQLAKTLDMYLGAHLTNIEGKNERNQLYGKAGAFRPKSYGMEYRTPSNIWLESDMLAMFVHRAVQETFKFMVNLGGDYFDRMTEDGTYQDWIDNGEVKSRGALMFNSGRVESYYLNGVNELEKRGV